MTPCVGSVAYCRKVHQLVEWDCALGNYQGGAANMNQVDGVSDMLSLLCGSGGSAQKGDNATAWPLEFYSGGSCPPALALMPDTSISPLMPLVPFQLLPQC